MSTFYLFMLCDFSFFFMKVPFSQSCSALGTYSIPHSLLLYSVHVKWILICVQNVIKMKIHLIIYFVHSCCLWSFIFHLLGFWWLKTSFGAEAPPRIQGHPAAVQSEGQSREERWFKWFWELHGFWCRHAALNISETAGLWGFSHTVVSTIRTDMLEEFNIHSGQQFSSLVKKKHIYISCWCQRSKKKSRGSSEQRGDSNSLPPQKSCRRPASNRKRWATAAEQQHCLSPLTSRRRNMQCNLQLKGQTWTTENWKHAAIWQDAMSSVKFGW